MAPPERQYAVFCGAAILASLTTFQQVRALVRAQAACFVTPKNPKWLAFFCILAVSLLDVLW